jgi:DNA-binding CsgD family transcriptional regulator/PAS domain-containing protein
VSISLQKSKPAAHRTGFATTLRADIDPVPHAGVARTAGGCSRTSAAAVEISPPIGGYAAPCDASDILQVSALIGDIYDASLRPALWPDVLRACAQFVGGSAAALFSKDASRKSIDVFYDDGGLDPHYKQLYFDKYVKLDPSHIGQCFAEIGKPISTVDLFPYAEFTETRFFKEWSLPQRLVDFVCVLLDKSAAGTTMFGVFRHERDGLVDEATRRRLALIVPHLRRAAVIGRVIEQKTAEAATFADTFDGLSAGMFLVDGAGRIVHANPSGHAMLAEATVLRTVGGKLLAGDAEASSALSEIFATAGGGDAAVGVKGIAVPLAARDGERYVAHVLPLTSARRRRAAASYCAVAALFVQKASLATTSPPEVIARTFNLTPTELRVLLAIVEVGGVAETSEVLGVGEATVKTHLHRLFCKTGTGRQAQLVKLVAGYASPLAPAVPAAA